MEILSVANLQSIINSLNMFSTNIRNYNIYYVVLFSLKKPFVFINYSLPTITFQVQVVQKKFHDDSENSMRQNSKTHLLCILALLHLSSSILWIPNLRNYACHTHTTGYGNSPGLNIFQFALIFIWENIYPWNSRVKL